MTRNKNVVAVLTIRTNNKLTSKVEIHSNAGHGDFYHWYTKTGRTWKEVRLSNRNDGQRWNHQPRGFEVLAKRFENSKVTIKQKRLYKTFLSCPIDQLPGYIPVIIRRSNLNSKPASRGILLLTSLRAEISS